MSSEGVSRQGWRELLQGVYTEETLPLDLVEYNQKYEAEIDSGKTERAQRLDQTYLWARSVSCPSCNRVIPLSPNWRLDSKGKRLPTTAQRTDR